MAVVLFSQLESGSYLMPSFNSWSFVSAHVALFNCINRIFKHIMLNIHFLYMCYMSVMV